MNLLKIYNEGEINSLKKRGINLFKKILSLDLSNVDINYVNIIKKFFDDDNLLKKLKSFNFNKIFNMLNINEKEVFIDKLIEISESYSFNSFSYEVFEFMIKNKVDENKIDKVKKRLDELKKI